MDRHFSPRLHALLADSRSDSFACFALVHRIRVVKRTLWWCAPIACCTTGTKISSSGVMSRDQRKRSSVFSLLHNLRSERIEYSDCKSSALSNLSGATDGRPRFADALRKSPSITHSASPTMRLIPRSG